VAFAERITAHKTLLNMHYWRGFLFLLVVVMVDRVEASKNLEILKANQARLMNYSHLFSSHAFKQDCDAKLKKIGRQIYNIEKQLNAKS
jgi:hypothetical protein